MDARRVELQQGAIKGSGQKYQFGIGHPADAGFDLGDGIPANIPAQRRWQIPASAG